MIHVRIVRPSARLPKHCLCGGGQGVEGDKTDKYPGEEKALMMEYEAEKISA